MQIGKLSIGRRHYRGGLLWWYVGVGVAAQIDNQLALLGFDKERVSLLTYGPTTNLYQSVFIKSKHTFPGGEGAPTTGTLQSSTLTSPALGRIEWTYWIYLPPSYAVSPTRRYPTFYLLHGSPGGPGHWFQAAHAATTADAPMMAGKMRETILIRADGNGPVHRFSEWANGFDGRQLNNPSRLLQTQAGKLAVSSMLFVIVVGTTDGRSFDEGVALFEQLRKTAVRVHLLTAVGGHAWPLWARQLREALPLLESSHSSARDHLLLRKTAASFSPLKPTSLFCSRPSAGGGMKHMREEKRCLC
jgi:S-formylglutathione hydrolase FrmB